MITPHPAMTKLVADIEQTRKAFRAKARAVVWDAIRDAELLSTAIGDISVDEAWEAWKKKLIESLNDR